MSFVRAAPQVLDEIHKETEETKKGSEKLIDTLKVADGPACSTLSVQLPRVHADDLCA